MGAAHGLAGIGLVPDIVIAGELAGRLEGVGAPGHTLGAPDMRQPVRALAAEIPVRLAQRHRRVHLVQRHPLHVEGLQQVQLGPQRIAIHRRGDDVEALAAGRAQLVDDLVVGADTGEIDLDAGLVGKALHEAFRQVIRPHHDVDLARRGENAAADDGRHGKAGTGQRRGFQEGSPSQTGLEAEIPHVPFSCSVRLAMIGGRLLPLLSRKVLSVVCVSVLVVLFPHCKNLIAPQHCGLEPRVENYGARD